MREQKKVTNIFFKKRRDFGGGLLYVKFRGYNSWVQKKQNKHTHKHLCIYIRKIARERVELKKKIIQQQQSLLFCSSCHGQQCDLTVPSHCCSISFASATHRHDRQ